MKPPPTDLAILREIYKRHYHAYAAYSRDKPTRKTKVYVPLDLDSIAAHFQIDEDIIFGRIYYHLNPRFSFKQADGPKVEFFMKNFQDEMHVMQFPLLASALAELQDEHAKHQLATWLSIAALLASVVAVYVSVFQK